MWSYLKNNEWIQLSQDTSDNIEQEYIKHKIGTRDSQRVYHCFGRGESAIIDFRDMKTTCGSGRCIMNNHGGCFNQSHVTFPIKRE